MDSPKIFRIVTKDQKRRESRQRWMMRGGMFVVVSAICICVCWQFCGKSRTMAQSPETFPIDLEMSRTPGAPTIVLMLEPGSTSSAECLSELRKALDNNKSTTLLLINQASKPAPLLDSTGRHPNTKILAGDDTKARKFNLCETGDCLIYDGRGHLLFKGNLNTAENNQRAEIEFALAGFRRPEPVQSNGALSALQE